MIIQSQPVSLNSNKYYNSIPTIKDMVLQITTEFLQFHL